MPARVNRIQLNEKHREAIRTSQLLNRLQSYALNEVDPQSGKPIEMKSTQVKAIEVLLDRVLPKMQSVEGGLDLTHKKHEDAIGELE